MNHPTPEELHDIAYGFSPKDEHVLDCADCRSTVSLLHEERAMLRRALSAPAPASRWGRAVPLAAAAALAAILLWSALPPRVHVPAAPPVQEERYDVERLVREYLGPNELRRRVARKALLAYGGAALPALRKAGAKDLVDEIVGVRTLDVLNTRMALDFKDAPLSDVVDYIREFTGLNFVIDSEVSLDAKVTVEAKNLTLEATLKRILDPLSLGFFVDQGIVRITTAEKARPKDPEAFVPVRLPVPAAGTAEVDQLSSDSLDLRDQASKKLKELGFAAETALWKGLSGEAGPACADLLLQLYERRVGLKAAPEPALASKVSLNFTDAPLPEVLQFLTQSTGTSIVLDPRVGDHRITIKIADLELRHALKLFLSFFGLCHSDVRGVVWIGRSEDAPRRTKFEPQATLWASPEEKWDAFLQNPDSARGFAAIPVLRWAAARVDAERAAKCETIVQDILAKTEGWYPDEPSPAHALKRIQGVRVSLQFVDASLEDVVAFLSDFAGVPIQLAVPSPAWRVTLRLNQVPLSVVLDLLTLPFGWTAAVDGQGVIIRKR